MRLGQDVLTDLPRALAREWLLADGLGGSAYGTVAGAHARHAHALLTTAGPHGRTAVALLKLDERLTTDAGPHELAVNLHQGDAVRPTGHLLLEEFRLDPWPTWRFRLGDVTLEKTVMLLQGHHAVAIAYRQLDGPPARLALSPLVVARASGGRTRDDQEMRGVVQGLPGRVRIETAPGSPSLTVWHNGALLPARAWVRGLAYPADRGGDEALEDAFIPGHLEGPIAAGGAFHVVASTEEDLFRALAVEGRLGTPPPRTLAECVAALEGHERQRLAGARKAALEGADFTARQAAAAHGGPGEAAARRRQPLLDERDGWTLRLAGAVEHALARRGPRLTLLASLPGGDERGVAALRALPGLIALRRFDDASAVLRGYVEYLDEGLAPERFDPDDGRPVYGDPEASLWMVHAGELLARRSGDVEMVRDGLYPMFEGLMQAFRSGARGGVRVDADGLLAVGDGARAGKRATLNALWYHALVAMAQLARLVGRKESGAFYLAWAREHQKTFNDRFWDDARGCLIPVLDAGAGSPEPDQLLAIALPPSLLPADRSARLVATIERELFTPFGLKAAPGAPRVHPASLGGFYTAYLRVHNRSADAHARVLGWIEELAAALDEDGPGLPPVAYVAEDAARRGPASAGPWLRVGDATCTVAAAELLRVWVEEVDHAQEPAAVV